ncbi:MAG TPA: serine/threonine-protein kinase [Burkholderiales bacterium]|nr:serine/threonine-protein kinase [Burkholderiales bacterium]
MLQRLGKYEITEVLGKGAMGVVYKGFDPGIRRTVAIKTIRRELIESDGTAGRMIARFRNEAQAAGRLAHPGIVAVYDYGEDAEVAYIAMEYVEGNSLREYFSRGTRFPEHDAISIMSQLLEALAHAHERRVWHRDIKPANLIVMRNGRVKVADFGIARVEASELTQTGAVMGSPGYMAPEQYAAAGIDQRADIFAAGVVCYQLLTNVKPFSGTAEQIAYAVCHIEVPALSTVDPGHRWERYDAIVAKALAKRPEERYQSAGAFLAVLLEAHAAPASPTVSDETVITEILKPAAAVDPSSPPRPQTVPPASAAPSSPQQGPAWRGKWAIAAGVVALVVAAGLWLLLSQRAAPPPPAAEHTAAAPKTGRPEQEALFWESVRNSSSPAELNAYLAQYPDGTFAPLARARLEALAAAEAKRAADIKAKAAVAAAAPKTAPPAAAQPAASAGRFDGAWTARFTCEAFEDRPAGSWNGPAEIRSGEVLVSWGKPGEPGSGNLQGKVAQDDRVALAGTGITRRKASLGQAYRARFDGRFGTRGYESSGTLGKRKCTLALTRASFGAQPSAAPAINVGRFDGSWVARFSCDAIQELPAESWNRAAEIRSGEVRVSWGKPGQPKSGQFQGRIAEDDRLALAGTGTSGLKSHYGKDYPIRFDGRFGARGYEGAGKLGTRKCTLALTRASG